MAQDYDLYTKARKKVRAKKGFYRHFSVYVAFALFFFSMNLATFDGEVFPLIPWGTMILIHYFFTFGLPGIPFVDERWEEKQFIKELDKLESADPKEYKTTLPSGKYADPTPFSDLKRIYTKRWNNSDFV